MKNIADLQNELEVLFGSIISDMTSTDLNLILSFIITNFASDFPEVYSRIYKVSDTTDTMLKIYLHEIHDDLLEIKMLCPIKNNIINLIPSYYDSKDNPYQVIQESVAIQLAAQYVNSVSSYYIPKKPLIMTDDTGEYFVLKKDSIVIANVERILDINRIEEHIYSILRYYTYAKFIDFIINQSFGSMLDMNERIFNMMYNSIEQDMSSGDFEGVQSVSLGSLSVSFNNKINNYSSALTSLANNLSNPTMIQQLNQQKDKYQKLFKRKKNVFYNYMF